MEQMSPDGAFPMVDGWGQVSGRSRKHRCSRRLAAVAHVMTNRSLSLCPIVTIHTTPFMCPRDDSCPAVRGRRLLLVSRRGVVSGDGQLTKTFFVKSSPNFYCKFKLNS